MFEAYKIGIRLTLINHVSHGMSSIISQFGAAHSSADRLKSTLKEIKLLGVAGASIAAPGYMGLGIISQTIKPASEYLHQLRMMNNEGMKHHEIVKATQASWSLINSVPTSSVTENLQAIRELKMVVGSVGHAIEVLPVVQKVQGILETLRHDHGSAKSESYELAKALEMKGSVRNPEQLHEGAHFMTKAIVAMGGKVGASDFLSAFKYGRSATIGWNNDFTYGILPTLIQEMKTQGGSGGGTGGPGTALMSAYAAVVGGTITQRALQTWEKLGLVDPKHVVRTKDGHIKGVLPGGIRGSDTFQANPYEWVQGTLMPALVKSGYTTEPQQRQVLQYLFPNRTAGFAISQFALQGWKFERDKQLIGQAKGLEGYNELVKTDPIMAQIALQKQWNSMLAILGFQLMPPLLKGMTWLLNLVRGIAKWSNDHPTATKTFMYIFTGLSAFLAIAGTAITLFAGFRALRLVFTVLGAASGPGSIGGLVTALGKGGLVGVLTTLIGLIPVAYEWSKKHDFGGAIWDWSHYEDGKNKFNPLNWLDHMPAGNKPATYETVKPGNGRPIQVKTQLNLDGRKVAEVVTSHQATAAERPQHMPGPFDTGMTLAPVGF